MKSVILCAALLLFSCGAPALAQYDSTLGRPGKPSLTGGTNLKPSAGHSTHHRRRVKHRKRRAAIKSPPPMHNPY
jgi:hypothetical protein